MNKNVDLKKLSSERLLSFYKKERKRFNRAGRWVCGCCGELLWDLYPKKYKYLEAEYNAEKAWLLEIKKELNTREHIA